MKRQSEIRNVEILPAELIFPFNDTVKGKFVALGVCGEDSRDGFTGSPIRTSPIVAFDVENGTIETMNTLYKIVK